jgi:anaerobic ribonucleoside-triphosphate reductase activating protein
MTFTGHTLAELREQNREGWAELLAVTDLLLNGRYDADLPDLHRPWVGSTNQQFHFLTDRYRSLAMGLDSVPDRLEVRIRADGTVFVNGQAGDHELNALLEDAELRRMPPCSAVHRPWLIGPTRSQ